MIGPQMNSANNDAAFANKYILRTQKCNDQEIRKLNNPTWNPQQQQQQVPINPNLPYPPETAKSRSEFVYPPKPHQTQPPSEGSGSAPAGSGSAPAGSGSAPEWRDVAPPSQGQKRTHAPPSNRDSKRVRWADEVDDKPQQPDQNQWASRDEQSLKEQLPQAPWDEQTKPEDSLNKPQNKPQNQPQPAAPRPWSSSSESSEEKQPASETRPDDLSASRKVQDSVEDSWAAEWGQVFEEKDRDTGRHEESGFLKTGRRDQRRQRVSPQKKPSTTSKCTITGDTTKMMDGTTKTLPHNIDCVRMMVMRTDVKIAVLTKPTTTGTWTMVVVPTCFVEVVFTPDGVPVVHVNKTVPPMDMHKPIPVPKCHMTMMKTPTTVFVATRTMGVKVDTQTVMMAMRYPGKTTGVCTNTIKVTDDVTTTMPPPLATIFNKYVKATHKVCPDVKPKSTSSWYSLGLW